MRQRVRAKFHEHARMRLSQDGVNRVRFHESGTASSVKALN
jgi:hypothetical protein